MIIFSYLPLAFITAFLFFQTALIKINSTVFLGSPDSAHQITVYLNQKDHETFKSDFADLISHTHFLTVAEQIKDFKDNSLLEIDDVYTEADLRDLLSPALTTYLKNDQSFSEFKDRAKNKSYILDYFYKGDWSDKLNKIQALVDNYSTVFLLILSIFIFIFTVLLMNHILISKKETLEIYTVFGESPDRIIFPYTVKFFAIAASGWVIALGISFILYKYVLNQLMAYNYFYFLSQRMQFLTIYSIALSIAPYLLSLVVTYFLFRKKLVTLYYNYEK